MQKQMQEKKWSNNKYPLYPQPTPTQSNYAIIIIHIKYCYKKKKTFIISLVSCLWHNKYQNYWEQLFNYNWGIKGQIPNVS